MTEKREPQRHRDTEKKRRGKGRMKKRIEDKDEV
jgi:hypothetical protein